MGLGINYVIRANHLVRLITSSTTDRCLQISTISFFKAIDDLKNTHVCYCYPWRPVQLSYKSIVVLQTIFLCGIYPAMSKSRK